MKRDVPQARHDFAVGGRSTPPASPSRPTAWAAAPETWSEFRDVAGFPGRRGLRNRVTDTLEIALMGDGVAPKDVYPCDVERAFKALDRIRPAVSHRIAQTAVVSGRRGVPPSAHRGRCRAPEGTNALPGRFADTLIAGGTSKHFVTRDGGAGIAVQDLRASASRRFDPGQPVEVTWPPDAGRFVER